MQVHQANCVTACTRVIKHFCFPEPLLKCISHASASTPKPWWKFNALVWQHAFPVVSHTSSVLRRTGSFVPFITRGCKPLISSDEACWRIVVLQKESRSRFVFGLSILFRALLLTCHVDKVIINSFFMLVTALLQQLSATLTTANAEFVFASGLIGAWLTAPVWWTGSVGAANGKPVSQLRAK